MVKFRGKVPIRRRAGILAVALFCVFIVAMMLSREDLAASAGVPAKITSSEVSAQTLPSAKALSKISAELLQDTANGKSAPFLVLMEEQANLTAAYGMKDQDARGWYVYNTLTAHADRTQAGIRAMLQARGVTYRVFWISNALYMVGDRALVESIAARSDVRKIEDNRPFRAIDPIREAPSPAIPNAPEWGVQNVRAPEVWALGYTGQGVVIGNADTGMRWTHQAIKGHYRGWNGATADHNYNWWDGIRAPTPGNPCGLMPSREPCDDDELLGGGHGTHTTGTTNGDDGQGNQVGVAPGAKWIGCRNLDRGVGYPVSYLECFQFFLAPHDLDGNNPNPTLRPHVENNSWTCIEGCPGVILQPAVENSQAAGIFVEASAGNDGPACSTIAWEPQIFEATFDTGAIEIANALADFSSRGPVVRDGSMRLKPNVSAPGVNVRSSLRGSDTAYGNLSGTSMAGPHTVGVVALLWSARPDLARQITETKTLLQLSANPAVTVPDRQTPDCGGTPPTQIPNNYFGWGRVDVLAAVTRAQATVTPMPTVTPQATFTVGTPAATRTPASPFPTSTPIAPTATTTSTAIAATSTSTTGVPTGSAIATNTTLATSTATTTRTATLVPTGTNTVIVPTLTATTTRTATTIPVLTPTLTGTATTAPSQTPGQPSATLVATAIQTNTTVPSSTAIATSTSIQTNTAVVPSSTPRPPTQTSVPTGVPTNTVVPSSTSISTNTAVAPSATPRPPTQTPGGSTATLEPTAVPTSTSVASSTPTVCTIAFTDVPADSTFYIWIRCLACRGIISGYSDGTFRPGNEITRGQIAKMVSNSAGFSEDPGPQIYEDVPSSNPFYQWINRLSIRGHMGGYNCGLVPEEPCNPPDNRPYFRPFANATRGQLSKIVSNAAGIGGDPTGLYYTDVPEGNPFYLWVMRLTIIGVMSGYPCGGEGEPCDDQNRPYFRPFTNVTRGQASKIVANTFFPDCQSP